MLRWKLQLVAARRSDSDADADADADADCRSGNVRHVEVALLDDSN